MNEKKKSKEKKGLGIKVYIWKAFFSSFKTPSIPFLLFIFRVYSWFKSNKSEF